MEYLKTASSILTILFFVCYAYQFVYMAVSLVSKPRPHRADKPHRFAVLICARNEERVIGTLIRSLTEQTYPSELVDIFVMADNCTDRTAEVAATAGARVWRRRDSVRVGKGYALDALLCGMAQDGYTDYDAYLVFDADNIPAADYLEQINRVFSDGYDIVTGYRNSKNFGDNWISAGYGLCFLRDARLLNYPRTRLGLSGVVTGTGFLFSRRILEKQGGGWPYHSLSEDTEFSVDHILSGERIGMAYDAVFYDEQPTSFRQSWYQRIRWTRGSLEVLAKYGKRLLVGALRGRFVCFDMLMSVFPAIFFTVVGLLLNGVIATADAAMGGGAEALVSVAVTFGMLMLTMLFMGAVVMLSEWRRIWIPGRKKLLYVLTFPLYMLTFIPIAIVALFSRRVTWKPIEHGAEGTSIPNHTSYLSQSRGETHV